jgi:hypothetical protein
MRSSSGDLERAQPREHLRRRREAARDLRGEPAELDDGCPDLHEVEVDLAEQDPAAEGDEDVAARGDIGEEHRRR